MTLFNLPIIRDALEGKVSLESPPPPPLPGLSGPGLLPRAPYRAVDDGLRCTPAVAPGMAA